MSALSSALLDLVANIDPNEVYEREVRQALQTQLYDLSFHAFEQVVKELLTRLGYSDARLLERTAWRQVTRHGGRDMEAYAAVGLSKARIVLQIKQYRRPVSRRFIDELAGVIQRIGAREGIVIATSHFSEVAKSAAASFRQAPIRLIDGEELLRLLVRHQVGVTTKSQDGSAHIDVDFDYFDHLQRQYPRKASSNVLLPARNGEAIAPSLPAYSEVETPNAPLMLWRTHFLAGINSLWLLAPVPGALTAQTLPLALVLVTIGALLPDIDIVGSKITQFGAFGIRPLTPVAQELQRTFGHRGILHTPVTLLPVAILSLVCARWTGPVPGSALLLGYASHLLMDAMTRAGISRLPFSPKRLHLLPRSLRIVTGSVQEDMLLFCLALTTLPLLLPFLFLR